MVTDISALFVAPEDGDTITNPLGGKMIVKLDDAATGNAFSVYENVIPAGSAGPRPHVHLNHDEIFYVLDGELTVQIDARTVTAPAGSFVVVPRGTVHQPSNPGQEPTRVLLMFSPAGMGDFFKEVAERRLPLQRAPDDPAVTAELSALTARYGYVFADDA